jgi:hypothetical protein
MSLRLRFVILPIVVVLAGLGGLSLVEACNARAQVRAEAEVSVKMGRLLAASAISHAAGSLTA